MAATVAYVGSQGRNLFLRSVANQIIGVDTNPNPANAAIVVREWSNRDSARRRRQPTAVQNPYAEVDYKTSGGHDSYNAMMLSLSKRSATGLSLNVQYTLGKSYGNTAGSNEALTSGNNARHALGLRLRQRLQQLRRPPHVQPERALPDPLRPEPQARRRRASRTRSSAAGTSAASSTRAAACRCNVLVTRPDIVYLDAAGNVFTNPAAGRTAVINTPGGGASRNVRRPDLDSGRGSVHPGRRPAVPEPGGVCDAQRRARSATWNGTRSTDRASGRSTSSASKHLPFSPERNVEFRIEVFNLFNIANFANPVGTLPLAMPGNALTEANRVQPGQPYTAAAAGTFGSMTSTVGRTVGLGTARQIQFALRLNF